VEEHQAEEQRRGRHVDPGPEAQGPLERVLRVELQLLGEDRLQVVEARALVGREERRAA
jgi:hypothetical protein